MCRDCGLPRSPADLSKWIFTVEQKFCISEKFRLKLKSSVWLSKNYNIPESTICNWALSFRKHKTVKVGSGRPLALGESQGQELYDQINEDVIGTRKSNFSDIFHRNCSRTQRYR